ncbi:hypothetical protein QFC21_006775 [Naganishia friedmannii]|uniref:Uncharacterized protein n=1 Tax=Naganishia friedmannii TaxID=89922 RepID=A0ACC2UZN8_9TREE|nr:hypothetical protein QFC21_006775 [Naganishia friedmannii]
MQFLQSKILAYGVLSTGLALAVLSNAWNARKAFYPAAVQVASSSGSLLHLYDKSWYFFTETMLALTMFRDDLDLHLAIMFTTLLFLKCFHWISSDRVDYMDQFPPPGPSTRFHVRLSSALVSLMVLDATALMYCYNLVMQSAISGNNHGRISGSAIFFGTEFALLLTTSLSIIAKYTINIIDLVRARGQEDAPPWEGKSMAVFWVDLTYHAIKLVIYTAFFYTIFILSGNVPINHIVPLYLTFRAFASKCVDLRRYRQATRNMDERYPDATQAEIDGLGGGSCVICREEMRQPTEEERMVGGAGSGVNETPKKLACGHVFHFHCLRSWLERQQSCPTCRRTVLETAGTRPVTIIVPPPPQPAQAPAHPYAAQPTALGAAAMPAGPHAEVNSHAPGHQTLANQLRPIGIWQTDRFAATLGVSPIVQSFRQRMSDLSRTAGPMSPRLSDSSSTSSVNPPWIEVDRPAIHVAPPTAEQASAFRALPWEALTMAERQRAIRGQKTEESQGPMVNSDLQAAQQQQQQQQQSPQEVQYMRNLAVGSESETPLASHTPVSSQAPEVFSEIHASRLRTRSMARSMSNASTTSDAQESPSGGPSPAQMAAMAALRRANSHRKTSTNLSKNIDETAPYAIQPISPPGEARVNFGASDIWSPDVGFPFTTSPRNDAAIGPAMPEHVVVRGLHRAKNYLVPLFIDQSQSAGSSSVEPTTLPLSPRSVIASLRWSTEQLKRSVQGGSGDQWRESRLDLERLDTEIGQVLSGLAPGPANERPMQRATDASVFESVEK